MITQEKFAMNNKCINGKMDVVSLDKCNQFIDNQGFTLVELLMVIAIIGLLALLVIPQYDNLKNNAKKAQCKADLRTVEKSIYAYNLDRGAFPPNPGGPLDPAIFSVVNDPWGHQFVYYNIKEGGGTPYAITVPGTDDLNDDFDLYSTGINGASTGLLDPTSTSWDDIVRALDGAYVGDAEKY